MLLQIFQYFSSFIQDGWGLIFAFSALAMAISTKRFPAKGWLVLSFISLVISHLQWIYGILQNNYFDDLNENTMGVIDLFFDINYFMFELFIFLFIMFLYLKLSYNISPKGFLFRCKGRVSRSLYWSVTIIGTWASLYLMDTILDILNISGYGYYGLTGMPAIVSVGILLIGILMSLWVLFAINVRRWHDCNQSGWLFLLNFIPIMGTIISFLFLGIKRGTIGDNNFGEDSKL